MGEMVMKDLFNKENFVLSTFDAKQKRQSLVLSCLLILFFICSALTFINALYCFTDIVGCIVSGSPDVAIHDLLHSVPMFLSFFMTLWTLLGLHAFFRNASDERRNRSIFKNAIAILCFAGVNILYILVGLIDGQYGSLVEGGPSPIFPLDAILYSLLFIAIGVLALLYGKKWKDRAPYVVPSRGPIVQRARFWYCFFVSIWMLFALYCFAAFFFGFFIIDFVHGYQAYSIALMLVFLVNACFFIIWEFFFNELKEEKRKQYLFPMALIGLGISVVTAAFYFIALGLNLDAPSNIGFGLLPIAFAASVNIATMLMVLVPVIVSVVALIKGAKARKQK